jgi:hypothetical protein
MALSRRPVRIEVYDDDGVGVVNVDMHYVIETDAPDVLAATGSNRVRGVVLKCEAARASLANLLAALQVVDDGGWPAGAIALPHPRKP